MAKNDVSGADQTSRDNALAQLNWLVDMGADETIGDQPVDRFKESAARKPPVPDRPGRPDARTSKTTPRAASVVSDDNGDSVQDARKLAEACANIDDIAAALQGFEACALKRTATNLCYIDGNVNSRVLLIGEAPGRDEDIQGKPFVGRSGQLLDKMLSAIGLSRSETDPGKSVLISNVIFWRPPGNRKPTEAETLMCLPFVKRTIELMAPQFIVCLGATPTQRLIGRTEGILKLRGRWFTLPGGEREIPLLATLHPAYLLRQPAQKRLAWRDFLALKERLDSS